MIELILIMLGWGLAVALWLTLEERTHQRDNARWQVGFWRELWKREIDRRA